MIQKLFFAHEHRTPLDEGREGGGGKREEREGGGIKGTFLAE